VTEKREYYLLFQFAKEIIINIIISRTLILNSDWLFRRLFRVLYSKNLSKQTQKRPRRKKKTKNFPIYIKNCIAYILLKSPSNLNLGNMRNVNKLQ